MKDDLPWDSALTFEDYVMNLLDQESKKPAVEQFKGDAFQILIQLPGMRDRVTEIYKQWKGKK